MVFFHHINFATDEPHNTYIQLFRLLSYTFVLTLIHALLLFLAPKKIPFHEKIYASSIYLWLPLLPIMVYCAASSVYLLSGDIDNRWFGHDRLSFVFLRLYVSLNILGTLSELLSWWSSGRTKKDLLKRTPSLLHHAVSISAYTAVLLQPRLHYFAW